MSKKFDAEEYVSRWDDKLIPIMLFVIVSSMVGVYAMNVMLRPDCITHDYVFCGTALDSGHEEAGHPDEGASGSHPTAQPAGEDGHGHDHQGEGHAPH